MNKYYALKAYQRMVYSQKRKREELEFYREQAELDAKRKAEKTLPWMSGIVKSVNVDKKNRMVIFTVEDENSPDKEQIEFRTSKSGWFAFAFENFGGDRYEVYDRETGRTEKRVLVPLKVGDYLKFQYEKGEYANWIMFYPEKWIRNKGEKQNG